MKIKILRNLYCRYTDSAEDKFGIGTKLVKDQTLEINKIIKKSADNSLLEINNLFTCLMDNADFEIINEK